MSKQNINVILKQAQAQGARVIETGGKHPVKVYPPNTQRPIVIGKSHRGDDKNYCDMIVRELKRAGITITSCALLFVIIEKCFA